MPRFLVPPEHIQNKTFTLLGSEARHAALVLRKKVGDVIDLFDGKDLSYQGRITSVSSERIEGVIVAQEKGSRTHAINLVLCQALIKGPKWDWLVEKACEIGVSQLVPLITARTVVKPTRDSAQERWKRIALAASKQCGRSNVMEIPRPKTFSEAINNLPKDGLVIIPWEKENKMTIKEAYHRLFPSPQPSPKKGEGEMKPSPFSGEGDRRPDEGTMTINVFIGPEGGWDSSEVDLAIRHKAIPVRLGPTLLRSETAGLVAATLVLAECGVYS